MTNRSTPISSDRTTPELLLTVDREASTSLATQIEDQLRAAIRSGVLRPGARLPSSRDLADRLGVSRGVVVNGYMQLEAEGYLTTRRGSPTRVSMTGTTGDGVRTESSTGKVEVRFDLRPGIPDVSLFPRSLWLRSMRRVMTSMPDADLRYGDPRGVEVLRVALAEYLGRVRGVVADPERVVVTSGFAQGEGLVCAALNTAGVKRMAIEDPSHPDQRLAVIRAGLETVAVGVDPDGMRVDELAGTGAQAVMLTPAHQFPTGSVLAGERRTRLLSWVREQDAYVLEDDYDAEYRYDRSPVGALQGLEPERVVYAGSASKTLAPGLRLGWLVVPGDLIEAVTHEKRLADLSTAHIGQHVFADLLVRGEVDRHLRKARIVYRRRRDALVEALARELPEAQVDGIAAGLHAAVRLPDSDDEEAIGGEAEARGIAIGLMRPHRVSPTGHPPTLLLGYSQSSESAIARAVEALADAVRATRTR